jgi:LmbE family N-acetylglucosaminyl deacetylase
MKFLDMDTVLCLSPHPDDIELSAAGTILRFLDTHFISVICSIGSRGDNTSDYNRFKECKKFWQGVDNISIKLVGTFITDQTISELITSIEDIFGGDFQGILVPTYIDSHQEHQIINKVGLALARARKMSVLEYRSPSTMDSWYPNLFVDIKETEEDKILRMKTIVSQNKMYTKEEYLKASHIHLPSYRKNYRPVEQFKILEHSI